MARTRFVGDKGLTARMTTVMFLLGGLFVALIAILIAILPLQWAPFIAIIGLNIVTGYSGQISLGQGAFMGVGAYTTAYLETQHSVGVWWTVPVAGVVAGIAGFLFGLPALRLHGPYLALGTFAKLPHW